MKKFNVADWVNSVCNRLAEPFPLGRNIRTTQEQRTAIAEALRERNYTALEAERALPYLLYSKWAISKNFLHVSDFLEPDNIPIVDHLRIVQAQRRLAAQAAEAMFKARDRPREQENINAELLQQVTALTAQNLALREENATLKHKIFWNNKKGSNDAEQPNNTGEEPTLSTGWLEGVDVSRLRSMA